MEKLILPKNMFATSDWHLGHEKVLTFDRRPFVNLGQMHEVLIKNYNSRVGVDDICYFLGDMGFYDAGFDVIPKLNGKKILVAGNHDGSLNQMYKMGFDFVLNAAMVSLGKSIITMTHCPLRGVFREPSVNQDGVPMTNFRDGDNWHGEFKHYKFSIPDFGQFHLHGHTHKRKGNDVVLGRQWDVGVVGNNYQPVSFSQVESWIAKQGKSNG